jgi:hypothetical protein
MSSKKGTAKQDFSDAGSEKSYAKGETYGFTAGEFANFEAAGLIEAEAEKKTESAKTST